MQSLAITTDADCLVGMLLEEIADRSTEDQLSVLRDACNILQTHADLLAAHLAAHLVQHTAVQNSRKGGGDIDSGNLVSPMGGSLVYAGNELATR